VTQVVPAVHGAAFSIALHRMGAFRARERGAATDILPLVAEAQSTAGPVNSTMMSTLVRASVLARFNEILAARRVLDGLTEDLAQVAAFPSALELADVVTRVGTRPEPLLPTGRGFPVARGGLGNGGLRLAGADPGVGGACSSSERWGEAVTVQDALTTAELGRAADRVVRAARIARPGLPGDAARAVELSMPPPRRRPRWRCSPGGAIAQLRGGLEPAPRNRPGPATRSPHRR
jgi:hypothetical protein